MDKLTKMIATIGPSSDSEEIIESFINHGVNVFRFNFKHSAAEWHKERIQRVKNVSDRLNATVGILLDLQGPEVRLSMPFDQLEIREGEKITLGESVFKTKEKGFSFSDPEIINHLDNGQKILADDGLFVFTLEQMGKESYLLCHSNGVLKNKKTINIVGLKYKFPVIHDRDRSGLLLAKETGVNFIALSFVRNGQDLKTLREEMKKIDLNAQIVAKIETQLAIENIDEIIDETDLVMIARGDMGVEMPMEEVPFYQKQIIKKCLEKGVPVITATQMLESMTFKPIPTRAEVSDVANAIYDFTDAVMLSGETASGQYPLNAVKTMAKVAKFTEDKNRISDIRIQFDFDLNDNSKMVSDSAFNLYKALKRKEGSIKGFIVFTHTGKTAKLISRYRPHVPTFAFCPDKLVAKSLSASFGVFPITQDSLEKKDEIVKEDIEKALNYLNMKKLAEIKDKFIVIHGDFWKSDTGASTIRLVSF